MLDLHVLNLQALAEFSRTHCVSICAFLVPATLVATTLTMIFTALRCPPARVWQAAGVAGFFALVMILHVATWLSIGVIMAPTYILLGLASTCLLTNLVMIVLQRRLALNM
jgi:hypothetical protein